MAHLSSNQTNLADLKMYLFKDAAAGAPLATLFAQVALFSASLCLRGTRLCSEYDHSGMKTAFLYHICSVLLCYTNRWSRLGFFRRRCSDDLNSLANLICMTLGILLEKFYEKSLASLCFGLSMTILFLILVVIIQPRTDLGFLGFLNGATGAVAYNVFELKLGTWIVVVICFVFFRFKCWLDKNWLELELKQHGRTFLLPVYRTEKIKGNLSLWNPLMVLVIRSIDQLIIAGFYLVWAYAFLGTNCLNCASCSAMEKLKCGVIYVLWLFPAIIHRVYSLFQVKFLFLWRKTSIYSLFNSASAVSLSSLTPKFHPPSVEEVKGAKPIIEADRPLVSEPESESETVESPRPVVEENETGEEADEEAEKPKAEKKITRWVSFKEETNVVGELPESQKAALEEFKQLIREALNKHEFTAPPDPVVEEKKEEVKEEEKTPAKPVEDETKVEIEEKAQVSEKVVEIEAPVLGESKEEEKAEPAAVAAAETLVVETEAVVLDEYGAKTVEATEEIVMAVSVPAPAETGDASSSKEPESAPAEEPKGAETPAPPPPPPEEVSIWGIPLLADERTDVILLKFLRARDFKVKDAFTMIKNTVRWRKDFAIDALLEKDPGKELDKVVFMHGSDKEGHPVCYNVFKNNENWKYFSYMKKQLKFFGWWILFLEKSIRKLDFSPNGVNTIVQVIDLNHRDLGKWVPRQVMKEAFQLVQDNYPEFVAKQVFINVPTSDVAFISPFLTPRTKSKLVFSRSSISADALFKYIAPEQVPVDYGGFSKEGKQEFTSANPVTEFIMKPSTVRLGPKCTVVEYPVSEKSIVVWEFRVVERNVDYGALFVPSDENGYLEIISKTRWIYPAVERVISDGYKVGKAGKIVLIFYNRRFAETRLLYRFKTKPSSN